MNTESGKSVSVKINNKSFEVDNDMEIKFETVIRDEFNLNNKIFKLLVIDKTTGELIELVCEVKTNYKVKG